MRQVGLTLGISYSTISRHKAGINKKRYRNVNCSSVKQIYD